MSASTEVATQESKELEELAALEAQASQFANQSLRDERIKVPMLSVVQGTTRNKPPGADGGEFFNSVTGEVYGDEIELLIAIFNRGRFHAEKDERGKRTGKTFVAGPEAVVPGSWPEQWKGQVFSELPEAEETYKRLVNDGKMDWGSGPPIETTFNFTGIVLGDDVSPIPVRLSLKKSGVKTANKVITLLKALRTNWDKAIRLNTKEVEGNEGLYYVVMADGYGVSPEPEQRRAAVELAIAAEQVGLSPVGEADEGEAGAAPRAKPERKAAGTRNLD